jgi:hypothetical protein
MKLLLAATVVGTVLGGVALLDAQLGASSAPAWARFQEQCRADEIPLDQCRRLFLRTSP